MVIYRRIFLVIALILNAKCVLGAPRSGLRPELGPSHWYGEFSDSEIPVLFDLSRRYSEDLIVGGLVIYPREITFISLIRTAGEQGYSVRVISMQLPPKNGQMPTEIALPIAAPDAVMLQRLWTSELRKVGVWKGGEMNTAPTFHFSGYVDGWLVAGTAKPGNQNEIRQNVLCMVEVFQVLRRMAFASLDERTQLTKKLHSLLVSVTVDKNERR